MEEVSLSIDSLQAKKPKSMLKIHSSSMIILSYFELCSTNVQN